jgi:hypothetical protein
MTTDLIPDPNERAEEGQGKQQERPGTKRPRESQIPSKQEILGKLAQMPGLVAIGILKPASANSMRGVYSELLRSLTGGADARQALATSDVLAAAREHPELLKLLSPLLTDEQIELLMAETGEDELGQA